MSEQLEFVVALKGSEPILYKINKILSGEAPKSGVTPETLANTLKNCLISAGVHGNFEIELKEKQDFDYTSQPSKSALDWLEAEEQGFISFESLACLDGNISFTD